MSVRGGAGAAAGVAALVTLIVRIGYLRGLAGDPLWATPVLDAAMHLDWARGILEGTWPEPVAFFRAPGYPYFLALLLGLVGDDPFRVVTVQLLVGAVVPVLAALLAGRLFGHAAAWIAGLGAAVYPPLIFFDAQLLAVAAVVPAATAATWVSVAGIRSGGTRPLVAAALLWSFAAIIRPPLLLPGILLAGITVTRGRAGLKRAGALAAIVLALPLAISARNAAVGDPVFLASQGGLNFHLGNGLAADGHSATFASAPAATGYRMLDAARRIAENDSGRSLSSREVSGYWTRRTLHEIGENPGRWFGLVVKKFVLVVGAREIPNNHDLALFRTRFPILALPGWGVWFPLAFVGAAAAVRRREGAFVVGSVAAILATCILFFVNARFRLPAAPLVLALGGGGLVVLVGALRRSEWRRLVTGLAVAGAVATLAHANPYRVPAEPWIGSYLLMAEAERNRNEPVRSLRWIEQALEREPGLYAARLAQVELLREVGRRDEALNVAERVLSVQPDDPAMLRQSAILLDLDDRPADALPRMERALRAEPTLPGGRIDLAVIMARLGRIDEARETLAEVMARGRSAETVRARELLRRIDAGAIPAVRPAP